MTKMKDGKYPISEKKRFITAEEAFGGGLSEIPDAVVEDMKKRGLEPRWLNYSKMSASGGVHIRGWKVYKAEGVVKDAIPHGSGDGTIQRGDLILGYKPSKGAGSAEIHREFLKQRRESKQNQAVEEFKQTAARLGVKIYEE